MRSTATCSFSYTGWRRLLQLVVYVPVPNCRLSVSWCEEGIIPSSGFSCRCCSRAIRSRIRLSMSAWVNGGALILGGSGFLVTSSFEASGRRRGITLVCGGSIFDCSARLGGDGFVQCVGAVLIFDTLPFPSVFSLVFSCVFRIVPEAI